MREAAADLNFEEAARLRDEIKRLRATELAVVDDPTARAGAGQGGRPRDGWNRRTRTACRGARPQTGPAATVPPRPLPARRTAQAEPRPDGPGDRSDPAGQVPRPALDPRPPRHARRQAAAEVIPQPRSPRGHNHIGDTPSPQGILRPSRRDRSQSYYEVHAGFAWRARRRLDGQPSHACDGHKETPSRSRTIASGEIVASSMPGSA